MSSGGIDQISFLPNEDVAAVLHSLREARFAWIAEEIEDAIRHGKVVEKEEVLGKSNKATKFEDIVPLLDHEQEQLLLQTLRHYFVALPEVWRSIQEELPNVLQNSKLNVTIVPPGTDVSPLELFSDKYEAVTQRLNIAIEKARLRPERDLDIRAED